MQRNPMLHISLRRGSNTFRLAQKHLFTNSYKTIRLTWLVVLWKVQNVRDHNDTITVNSVSTTLPRGYYSFSSLQTELRKHNISIERQPDGKCQLSATTDVNLKSLGQLLGFDQDKAILKNISTLSTKPIRMLGDLDTIKIFTNLVDDSQNVHYYYDDREKLYNSHFLCLVPVDASRGLDGVYSSIDVKHVQAPVRQMILQEFYFDVVSGGHSEDYEMNLDFVLE